MGIENFFPTSQNTMKVVSNVAKFVLIMKKKLENNIVWKYVKNIIKILKIASKLWIFFYKIAKNDQNVIKIAKIGY